MPNSIMQSLLVTNNPEAILGSNRFRNARHRLCEHILRKDFAGYWICKGPPTEIQTTKQFDKILIHIHGGGYIAGHPLGSLAQFLRVSELAAEQNLALGIFALHYSLGPKAKFPQQTKQAVAAFRYLIEELYISPRNIILEGDSAGGHLALSMLVELSRQGLPRPGGCILIYPWVNLNNSGASFQRNKFRDILNKKDLDHAASEVLGEHGRVEFAHICNFSIPRERKWAQILPRTWVSTGTEDCFVDDIVAFVENARSDGAEVSMQFATGKAHAWLTFDDAWDIRVYCQQEPSADLKNIMQGASHIFKGLSDILHFEGHNYTAHDK